MDLAGKNHTSESTKHSHIHVFTQQTLTIVVESTPTLLSRGEKTSMGLDTVLRSSQPLWNTCTGAEREGTLTDTHVRSEN